MSTGEFTQRPTRLPIVRHFVPCRKIERWRDGRSYSLECVIHQMRPIQNSVYPFVCSELWLFAQLTDGTGDYSFQVELVRFGSETTHRWPPQIINLGTDPLRVFDWPMCFTNVLFEEPGTYEFRLRCNGLLLDNVAPLQLERLI